MQSIVSEKFHVHMAKQFVESLSEGKRTFSETLTVNVDSVNVSVSGNVHALIRPNDLVVANTELRRIESVAANGTEFTINSAFSSAFAEEPFVTYSGATLHDTYYLFIGRSTPWPDGDSDVPVPTDAPANTTFAYWNDVLALRRITDADLVHVIPRHDWQSATQYSMYDHRVDAAQLAANVASGNAQPNYVITSDREVFRCVYDGRVNSGAISESVAEPTIAGQELVTDFTTSLGAPYNNYIWKYLYTVSSVDAQKFMTTDYIPVRSTHMTWGDNGDVYNDESHQYQVFDHARNSNGGIHQVIVESGGTSYENAPTVTISGDGVGAEAVAQLSGNTVVSISVVAPGSGYSYATVAITANGDSGVDATATPIISPRNEFKNSTGIFYRTNHGVNLEEELGAKYVMLYVQLYGSESGQITTANEYRRVGIIRNPVLTDGSVAIGDLYDMTTRLVFAAPPVASVTASEFTKDEVVFQPTSNAYGVVVEQTNTYLTVAHVGPSPFSTSGVVIGVGNGNTVALQSATGNVVSSAIPNVFTEIQPSGVTATLLEVQEPQVQRFSGDILYVSQREPVVRSENQVEILRTILEF